MKNAALTLRLTASLAKSLGRLARARGIPKSQLVREAVARYLAPSGPVVESPVLTASILAARWRDIPRLAPEEASEFQDDITAARKKMRLPAPAWE
ncbi:MAG: CopG family transcriptional regulator [Gemmatimonadaceae bacterium]